MRVVANVPGSLLPQTTPGCALCELDFRASNEFLLSDLLH